MTTGARHVVSLGRWTGFREYGEYLFTWYAMKRKVILIVSAISIATGAGWLESGDVVYEGRSH